jgi:hypothetical protein
MEIEIVPISVSDKACSRAKEDAGVRMYFVDSCCLVLSSDEKNLASSINSLRELDIVYASRVLQRMQDCQFLRCIKEGISSRRRGKYLTVEYTLILFWC